MAELTATKDKPKAKEEEAKKGPGRGRRVEIASKMTFSVDHKNAQYARLVIFNHGKKVGLIKATDVNDVPNAALEKAGLDLVGGNLLDGKEGVEYIQKMTEKGSTTGRPLTTAFATEVRPWIRRLKVSDYFGNRRSATTAARKAEEKAAEEKADKKKAAKKAEGTPDTQAEASAQS